LDGVGSDTLCESDLNGNWTASYAFLNGKRIARVALPAITVNYYFSDYLGSARVITGPTGNIEKESDYYPYGGEIAISGSDPNRYKFTGKERDSESGLDYFGARHYASASGRFMQPDELFSDQDESDPQSWNLYSYVRNNPLRNTDPTGHDCITNDGGRHWEYSGAGLTCAQVDEDSKNAQPSATVTATPGSLPTAIGLNAFFALDNAANTWFSPLTKAMGFTPSYMQDTPVSNSALGTTVNATVVAGTFLIGPGEVKTATGVIQISEHAAERMAEYGVTTAAVEKAIQVGEKFLDPKNDSTVYVVRKGMASGKDLAVAVSNKSGKLATVMTGSNVARTRFIPVK